MSTKGSRSSRGSPPGAPPRSKRAHRRFRLPKSKDKNREAGILFALATTWVGQFSVPHGESVALLRGGAGGGAAPLPFIGTRRPHRVSSENVMFQPRDRPDSTTKTLGVVRTFLGATTSCCLRTSVYELGTLCTILRHVVCHNCCNLQQPLRTRWSSNFVWSIYSPDPRRRVGSAVSS